MNTYEKFVKDYNNPNLTGHDVRRINKLNSKQYRRLLHKARANKDIPPVRHMNQTDAKFYTKKNGAYEVGKTIGEDYIYVGRFKKETTAKQVVEECKAVNWDITKIQDTLIAYKNDNVKNYTIINNYYVVQKSINGVNTIFATINKNKVDENTVKSIVDKFRLCGWNKTYTKRILTECGVD